MNRRYGTKVIKSLFLKNEHINDQALLKLKRITDNDDLPTVATDTSNKKQKQATSRRRYGHRIF